MTEEEAPETIFELTESHLDTGLRGIRDSGRYQAILDDHLTRFWRGH